MVLRTQLKGIDRHCRTRSPGIRTNLAELRADVSRYSFYRRWCVERYFARSHRSHDTSAITQLFAIKPIENKNTDDPFDSDLNQVPMESRRNQTRDTVTKYNNPRNFSRPLGTILIVFGILVLLHGEQRLELPPSAANTESGMLRYLLIQTALLDGKFPILPRLTLFIFTLLLALFFITCFVLIIISR